MRSTGKINILIVDDDKASELYLNVIVGKISNKVIFAKSGNEAVVFCYSYPDIDLVLMDIKMPGMDGYEATRKIRQFNKEVIIIAQTAFGTSGDREKALEAGCNDYIQKPINKYELLTLIQLHLDLKSQNQIPGMYTDKFMYKVKVVIIEDEKLSAEHLYMLIKKIDPSIYVVLTFDTVKQSIPALQSSIKTDILIIDAEQASGQNWKILSEIANDTYIILTTTHNEWTNNSKLNSLDFLLKPVGLDDLKNALERFRKYGRNDCLKMLDNIESSQKNIENRYKSHFMVFIDGLFTSFHTNNIDHFFLDDDIVMLVANRKFQHPLNFTIDQIETMLNPLEFFRINPKVIINRKSIENTIEHKSTVKIFSSALKEEHAIVSPERVSDFIEWQSKNSIATAGKPDVGREENL